MQGTVTELSWSLHLAITTVAPDAMPKAMCNVNQLVTFNAQFKVV